MAAEFPQETVPVPALGFAVQVLAVLVQSVYAAVALKDELRDVGVLDVGCLAELPVYYRKFLLLLLLRDDGADEQEGNQAYHCDCKREHQIIAPHHTLVSIADCRHQPGDGLHLHVGLAAGGIVQCLVDISVGPLQVPFFEEYAGQLDHCGMLLPGSDYVAGDRLRQICYFFILIVLASLPVDYGDKKCGH